MLSRRNVLAALLLLGLAAAAVEGSVVHTDDGCILETHCNACLLRLGTTGVVTVAFSLPKVAVAADRVAPALPLSHEDAVPRDVPSRGPPVA
jgi:hypothetical protein